MQPTARLDRIRHVRHERSTFEPRFFERAFAFWPIARAATTFAECADWPNVVEYGKAFLATWDPVPPVRFEPAKPRRRRRASEPEPIARDSLYDAMIVDRGIVPTRP